MKPGVINQISAQYDSLTAIVNKVSKSNNKDLVELKKQWETFGLLLQQFLQGHFEEVETLKKELTAQKMESEEIIKRLEEKVAELEAAVSKMDYAFSEKVCQREYAKVWNLLEKKTKVFLTTAEYINRLVKSSGVDYSVVIIEWGKALEGELEVKLYIPYFQYRTTPLPVEGGKFCQNMNRLLAGRINNLPFALMFAALKPTARKGNDYYNDFHTFIRVEKWDYGILQNPQFYEVGADYASTFRNGAAHSSIMSAEAAKECRRKTRTLINDFIMACPSKK